MNIDSIQRPSPRARCEFKYLLRRDQVDAIRVMARHYLEPDPLGEAGQYWVYSLYHDTERWLTACETIEGLHQRFKLRLRTYSLEGDGPYFAEIKRRVGATILKSRGALAREHVLDLITRSTDNVPALDARSKQTVDDFINHAATLDMRPRLWVRYLREAMVSPWGDGARLTFDSQLAVQLADPHRPLQPAEGNWTDVHLEAPCILELKFNGAFPSWMRQIVRSAELKRVSCSKYMQGVVQMGQLPWAQSERSVPWTD